MNTLNNPYAPTRRSAGNSNYQDNDNWKADGFMNVSIPHVRGPKKVGGLSLKMDNDTHRFVLEQYAECTTEEEQQAFVSRLKEALIVNIVLVDNTELEADGFQI